MAERPSYEGVLREAAEGGEGLVEVERRGDVALVRMNDPAKRNALSAALTVRLHAALREAAADPGVRAVVLTGAGGAFSAGGDLRLMTSVAHPLADEGAEGAADLWRWIRYQFGGVVRTIVQSDKIFVAAVGGAAAGVGLAFALACDVIVASEAARFVLAFGPLGLVPEVGTSWLLTRRLGYHATLDLYLSGRPLEAAEAARLGLVSELVPPGAEVDRALAACERLRALPAHALAMTKPLLRAVGDMSWHHALTMEEFAEPACFTTDAHREGVRAVARRISKAGP
jgi:2-(1,2-epoxy-1,2-dihydrophenyl)acetyl-CoA isomerase